MTKDEAFAVAEFIDMNIGDMVSRQAANEQKAEESFLKSDPDSVSKGDVIYRQDAIDAIFSEPLYKSGMKKRGAEEVVPAIFEKIKTLPSAQPERKTGKWVGAQAYCKHLEEKTGERYTPSGIENMIYCDECWQANDRRSSFCPNCGSYNGGEQDEGNASAK